LAVRAAAASRVALFVEKMPDWQGGWVKMIFETAFKVGRFQCEMRFNVEEKQTNVEWEPDVPKQGEITQADLKHYQKMRNRFYRLVCQKTGLNMMMVD
jgi:hypothetical protein